MPNELATAVLVARDSLAKAAGSTESPNCGKRTSPRHLVLDDGPDHAGVGRGVLPTAGASAAEGRLENILQHPFLVPFHQRMLQVALSCRSPAGQAVKTALLVTGNRGDESERRSPELEISPGLVIRANFDLLEAALENLVENAIEASPPDGEIPGSTCKRTVLHCRQGRRRWWKDLD